MSKFGAYREGMAPFVFGDDVWELIGQVVPLAAREGWLPELRVGEMEPGRNEMPPFCDGLKPLQVYASQGGWSYGMTLGPEHETIDFELKDGLGHWRWSKAPSLSFPSLKHAMTAANAWATEDL